MLRSENQSEFIYISRNNIENGPGKTRHMDYRSPLASSSDRKFPDLQK